MTCKEFEKMIPAFIGKKLDFVGLKKFIGHMDACDECQEELEIQFLVTEGMQRLENGNAFDLQSELESRLNEARSRVKFHMFFLYAGACLEAVVLLMVAGMVLWLIF